MASGRVFKPDDLLPQDLEEHSTIQVIQPTNSKIQEGNTEEMKVFFLDYQKDVKKVEMHSDKDIFDIEEVARSLFQLDDDLDVNIMDDKKQRTLEPGTKLKEIQNKLTFCIVTSDICTTTLRNFFVKKNPGKKTRVQICENSTVQELVKLSKEKLNITEDTKLVPMFKDLQLELLNNNNNNRFIISTIEPSTGKVCW